jgi:hypothetical protein
VVIEPGPALQLTSELRRKICGFFLICYSCKKRDAIPDVLNRNIYNLHTIVPLEDNLSRLGICLSVTTEYKFPPVPFLMISYVFLSAN